MDIAVQVRSVRKTYGSGPAAVAALRDVSVDFPAGEFTAVMGPSGSGKSTLLLCAAGLERFDAGEVIVAGTALRTASEARLTRLRRDSIGFVFQAFNLLPALSAAGNVALPARLAGRRVPAAEVENALSAVGLGGHGRRRPSELSGGQQQRVAIARALLAQPTVLFADEPTGALDAASSGQVLALLRELVDERGHTIVMVTHDPVAAAVADRVLLFADGQVVDELRHPTADAVAARTARVEAASC